MAAKKKFNIPTVDELELKRTPQITSQRAFKLFQRINETSKSAGEEKSSTKDNIPETNGTNNVPSKLVETRVSQSSSDNLESSKHYLEKQVIYPTNTSASSCFTSNTNFSTANNSKDGRDSTSRGQEIVAGKSFKDTFAFLKNTRHYEEAEAKMKEIESKSAPAATKTTVNVPSKPKPNAIQVNPRQKGNPVLKFIRCVPWEYSDIVPDYVMGTTTCALFLSLRYHHFNPNYIHDRLRLLGKSYELRILLILVDVKDPHQTLRELAKMAIMADLTLMLTWSSEEAGKYLETYKVYENKPVDALQGQNDSDHFSKLQDCLTTVKGINKTDVLTLNSTFGPLAGIAKAPKDDLVFLPGFGPLKATRLHGVFHEPFLAKRKKDDKDDTSTVNSSSLLGHDGGR